MPNAYTRTGVTIPCKVCGTDVYVEPKLIGRKKFCSKACFFVGRELKALFPKGHPDLVPPDKRGHTEATKAKISATQRLNPLTGENSPNWKGGHRTERRKAMGGWQYRDWRTAVFQRDNYTCVFCGQHGGWLEADHIKPWCKFIELRYDVDNGRTLCNPCHRLTGTWGRRALRENNDSL